MYIVVFLFRVALEGQEHWSGGMKRKAGSREAAEWSTNTAHTDTSKMLQSFTFSALINRRNLCVRKHSMKVMHRQNDTNTHTSTNTSVTPTATDKGIQSVSLLPLTAQHQFKIPPLRPNTSHNTALKRLVSKPRTLKPRRADKGTTMATRAPQDSSCF